MIIMIPLTTMKTMTLTIKTQVKSRMMTPTIKRILLRVGWRICSITKVKGGPSEEGFLMAINNEDIIRLFERLPEKAKQSAFDYMQYLFVQDRPDWNEISRIDPDDIPFSEEETQQLNNDEGFVTGEEAKREFNLKIDLP